MKTIFTTLLSLVSSASFASMINYYPADFQNKVESGMLKGDSLKRELNIILKSAHQKHAGQEDTLANSCQGNDCYQHRSLGYYEARKKMFGNIDLQQDKNGDYFVRDVYCHQEFTTDDFSTNKTIGPNMIPDSNVLNCEHTWPQSKFTGKYPASTQKSDLHHLYSTSSKANSVRGNFPFAEVINGHIPEAGCDISHSGMAATTPQGQGQGLSFEPPEDHKGNVARSLFYFATRYEMQITPAQEYYLRKWHKQDPVDEEERIRHEKIFAAQGNRNPYIDNPELVDLISDF